MRKLKLEELGRLTKDEFVSIDKIPVVVVLDNIRSGMNVGSVFRTCDAFKFQKLYLTGITAQPPHKEILKTAIGASESVEWAYMTDVKEAINHLKSEGFTIVGVEQTNQSIELQSYSVHKDLKYAIVLGNEVEGISDEIIQDIDIAIEIPQYGTKHSLNVSVCGGIVMWHFAQPFLHS
jgi:23S rRNA (guanosine2251-2'-O)-methyltransferase